MSYKSILIILITVFVLWVSIYLFNHVNPYIGIFLALATIIITLKTNFKNKDEKFN